MPMQEYLDKIGLEHLVENLKQTNVRVAEQDLTEEQQNQVRTNIGAVSADDVESAILASLITDTASGDPCAIPDGASAPVVDCKVQIVPKQEGSGTPSPSNVRPISGWTGMTMSRTGFNIWDEEWESGTIPINSGMPRPSSADWRSKNYIPVIPNTEYHLHNGGAANGIFLYWYDADKNYIGYTSKSELDTEKSFTADQNAYYMKFVMYQASTRYGNTYNHDICINVSGSKNGTYEPYNGQTYTKSWDTTVYGGSLDLTTGVLTVTYGMVDLGTIPWLLTPEGFMYSSELSDLIKKPSTSSVLANIICSELVANTAYRIYNGENGIGIHSNGGIRVRYTDMPTDTTAFRSAMSGVMLCYELAEPTTIQLTPTQVDTILGSNTFSADTGAVSLEYRCDTKLYIAKTIS